MSGLGIAHNNMSELPRKNNNKNMHEEGDKCQDKPQAGNVLSQ
jgi:hypothetical protein